MCQKWEGDCGLWVLNEIIQEIYTESLKKMWEPFGRNLLNSTANPAKLWWKIWLDWPCYFAGNSQATPMIFFKHSVYIFLTISLRTHKPQSPSHFWHIISQLQVVCKAFDPHDFNLEHHKYEYIAPICQQPIQNHRNINCIFFVFLWVLYFLDHKVSYEFYDLMIYQRNCKRYRFRVSSRIFSASLHYK